MFLLILDSLGNSELLLILVAALIFFGPRRLPQLSRQIGKSLSEFRRASDDFKRTWEREVNLEDFERGDAESPAGNSIFDKASERIRTARAAAARDTSAATTTTPESAPVVAPVDPSIVEPRQTTTQPETSAPTHAEGKETWF